MNDLEHRLSTLGGPAAAGPASDPASDPAVTGDLARGRRAARERRARRTALGGLGVLGIAAAVGVGLGTRSTGPVRPADDAGSSHRPATSASDPVPAHSHRPTHDSSHRPAPVSAKDMHLVVYRGEQEPGFTVTYVPAGFEVEGQDDVVLAVARPGDTTPISTFADKMVVTVQTEATHRELHLSGRAVDIDGDPGTLARTSDGGATLLDYHDGHRWIEIQVWNGIGLTDDEIVRFARGLTVSPDVETVS